MWCLESCGKWVLCLESCEYLGEQLRDTLLYLPCWDTPLLYGLIHASELLIFQLKLPRAFCDNMFGLVSSHASPLFWDEFSISATCRVLTNLIFRLTLPLASVWPFKSSTSIWDASCASLHVLASRRVAAGASEFPLSLNHYQVSICVVVFNSWMDYGLNMNSFFLSGCPKWQL